MINSPPSSCSTHLGVQAAGRKALSTSDEQLEAFMQGTRHWYDEDRINAIKTDEKLCSSHFPGERFDSYTSLIRHSVANPLQAFAQQIIEFGKKDCKITPLPEPMIGRKRHRDQVSEAGGDEPPSRSRAPKPRKR